MMVPGSKVPFIWKNAELYAKNFGDVSEKQGKKWSDTSHQLLQRNSGILWNTFHRQFWPIKDCNCRIEVAIMNAQSLT